MVLSENFSKVSLSYWVIPEVSGYTNLNEKRRKEKRGEERKFTNLIGHNIRILGVFFKRTGKATYSQ